MAPGNDAATRPIGVFDSGVGGLTVLHELLVQLPHEDFVYLADTARFPYGPRPADELRRFSLEVAEELLARRVKLLVVACNSASAAALPALQERMMETTLGVDVIGVVGPGAVQAVAATRNGKVGLLATDVTVRSGAYAEAIARIDPHVDLVAVPCHDLAEIIQRGFPMNEEVVEIVRGYCAPLREAGVDTVILGSTHYPLVRPLIQRILGRGVEIISSGVPLSRQVDHVLGSRGGGRPRAGEGEHPFTCTGDVESFRALGTRFLQMPLGEVVHIDLDTAGVAR
jgi:glutamate racemase